MQFEIEILGRMIYVDSLDPLKVAEEIYSQMVYVRHLSAEAIQVFTFGPTIQITVIDRSNTSVVVVDNKPDTVFCPSWKQLYTIGIGIGSNHFEALKNAIANVEERTLKAVKRLHA